VTGFIYDTFCATRIQAHALDRPVEALPRNLLLAMFDRFSRSDLPVLGQDGRLGSDGCYALHPTK